MDKHRILFLAANPVGFSALRLDEEARSIQETLRRAHQHEHFEFVPRLAARPMDLLHALRETRPSIVHFAGHAGSRGIYLVGEDGVPKCVTQSALVATFGAMTPSVEVVILNACATDDLAEALCAFVPVCVGTSATIADEAARAFSVGFFGALASRESVARAFLQGKAAMEIEDTGCQEVPRLHHRHDIDPARVLLVETSTVGPLRVRCQVTLEVSTPDGSKSQQTFDSSIVRVGSGRSNEIVVPYTRVSSEHGAFLCGIEDMHYNDLSRNGSTILRNGKPARQDLHRKSAKIELFDSVELGGSGVFVRLTNISRGR